ncbi:unnamed protein product [Rotaria sordida]|uniref:Gamma-glutamyltranspeptidase 1 n=1 Tax=Rotaria sordida TaxID=392033 RepID=A0A814F7V0_9BILA|nr:unnamed protein product [Rotaria sordida]CAF0979182.1 unnamed protein product [Rotaria sordida]
MDDRFAEDVADQLNQTYAIIPFLVVAKWNRKKIDFNREMNEATFNHPEAIKSYRSYHDYLEEAIATIERKFHGQGLLLDVHQHAQGNYTMVGILLTGAKLNRNELSSTSIELLIQSSCSQNRSECIRGSKAFGTFMESKELGIAYSSLNNPKPGNKTFYSGGFITKNYISRINAIQAELSYVMRNDFDRRFYATRFAQALVDFMLANDLLRTDNITLPHSHGNMVHLRDVFSNRRQIFIVTFVAVSVLVVVGVIIGLVLGLRRPFQNASEEVCSAGHETYIINGSSILGKYSRAAVAVDNGECSKVGRIILEKNGTTMDAALAAAICNGVMNTQSMGIGGGCVITIYSKKRNKAYSIIGREKAPLAANSTMFVGRKNMSLTGGLAIGVPGELRAYKKAYDEFGGGVLWKELFQPTIQLCREGFHVSEAQAQAIKETTRVILDDPAMREIFVKNSNTNELYGAGDLMKRPKLARTLEIIAEQGVDAFYTGELSDKIVKEIQDQGGIITKQDLADYDVDFQEALSIDLKSSLTAYTTHAPTSGPILAFILNILQGYYVHENNIKKSTTTSSLFYHRLIEAFKFAYAKRSELGDPSKINITELIHNLTSKEYVNNVRSRINDNKTFGFEYYGGAWLDKMTIGTAHLSVVGLDGDAVALSSTVNLFFGSKVLGPETDIIYNNEMDDFSTPNTTNNFGVPASLANYIAPGKRPVSSMAPLIIMEKHNQRIQQVLGASGGTRITTSIAQVAMLNLWFNDDIKKAIDSPRLHSQLLPQEVVAERGFDHDILKRLKDRGHNITCGVYGRSVIQGIEWRDEVNQYWANCDIRKGGAPDGI